ncbi:MAG: pirin family protein [Erysipelotrichaceae bacterium]
MQFRQTALIKTGIATKDGAGVKLTRVLGYNDTKVIDPFLMLDAFDSNNPDDYIKGFPMHPHRGIETFTYLIKGKIEHQDSLGNKGIIQDGMAQWMSSGSGIIHQEMPQVSQRLWGLQLWINLPSANKMDQPTYLDIREEQIKEIIEDKAHIRLISGSYKGIEAIKPHYVQARICDVSLLEDGVFTLDTPNTHTLFIYIFEGEVINLSDQRSYYAKQAVIFTLGDQLSLKATKDSRMMVYEGLALHQAIAWSGPIVMTTQNELQQAFNDLENGTFIKSYE